MITYLRHEFKSMARILRGIAIKRAYAIHTSYCPVNMIANLAGGTLFVVYCSTTTFELTMTKQTRATTQKGCTAVKVGVDDGAAKYKTTRSGKRREVVVHPTNLVENNEHGGVMVEKSLEDGLQRFPDSDDSDDSDYEDSDQVGNRDVSMDGMEESESAKDTTGDIIGNTETIQRDMDNGNSGEGNYGK